MSELLDKALKIALKTHTGQFRKKTGIPYIIHPLEVSKRLSLWGISDQNILAVGILHDTIEDAKELQSVMARLISDLGGPIYSMVNDLTIYKNDKKADYLLTFSTKPIGSLVVKLADRVCNLFDFYMSQDPYFKVYLDKTYGLFGIFEDRAAEIENVFGKEVMRNIDADIASLYYLTQKV